MTRASAGGADSHPLPNVDEELERQIAEAMGDQSVEDLMAQATPAPPPPLENPPAEGEEGATPVSAEDDDDAVNFELRRGRIHSIRGDDVFVDLVGIDAKMQGVVPLRQFERSPRIGSIMDFVVERMDEAEGLIHLSREGAVSRIAWDQMTVGTNVEARVTGKNKGGLELEMAGGIRGFMPASQIDLHHVDDLETFVGQKLHATVQEVDRRGKRVLLSRRRYLEKERERKRHQLVKEMAVDQVRQGVVTSIVKYGAFVDLGGIDGLIHISDLSYGRVDKPEEVVKVGQEVTVKVLKIEEDGNRIRLGFKQVMPDPWDGAESKYHVGEQLSGRIVRLADFGAFVEVEPGLEALLPISEMSWKRINKPSDVCREGDVLKMAVLTMDPAKKRMSLSLKQALGDPWQDIESKCPRHGLVEGTVMRTTAFGAFVEIETGLEGLVHISELADRRVGAVEEVLKIGDRRQFRVLSIEPDERKLSLSVKAVDAPPPAEKVAEGAMPQAAAPKRPQPRKRPGKGGIGTHGGLGIGLGDLRL